MAAILEKPSKRRRLDFNSDACCFCSNSFQENRTAMDPQKLDSLLDICKSRSDMKAATIVANESALQSGDLKLYYHKSCRARFVHPFYKKQTDGEVESCPELHQSPSLTRSQQSCRFNWKNDCFICGEQCSLKHKSKWSKIEGSIDANSNLYMKLLEAAKLKNDTSLIDRLVSTNGDLVAFEARYHRKKGCLAKLLVLAERSPDTKDQPQKKFIKACECLKFQLRNSIEEQKEVFEFSDIKSRLIEICKQEDIDEGNIPNNKQIKKSLQSLWSKIKFINRSGLSDLVCSVDITLDAALAKTKVLENTLVVVTDQQEYESALCNSFVDETSDERVILHQAANTLRKQLLKTEGLKKEYYSTSEISLTAQLEFLDPLLVCFVRWLSSQSNEDDEMKTNQDRRIVAVCSDLTSLVKPIITPKHLGLSTYLHHLYGSKKLIEDLNLHGYTMPYSEVRHFLTSSAVYMSSTQQRTPSGAIIPANLAISMEGNDQGRLLFGAADNWDHNENTLSGKRSTHAMTSITISTIPCQTQAERIPRIQERSFDTSVLSGGGLAHTLTYKKPDLRPSPQLSPPVRVEELQCPDTEAVKLFKLREIMYHMGRDKLVNVCDDRADRLPPWTVYQSVIESDNLYEPAEIVFNPIIMAPPNDYSTVYTTLKRTKEQMDALGQDVCPIVFDMGLLTKALEIVWARPIEFAGVIPIEGGMHYLMSLFGGIGHIYGDAGLKDLLVDSDVFAKLTAEHILSGKDFDRALKAIIMVDEVLNRRFLQQFYLWVEKNSKSLPVSLFQDLKAFDINTNDHSDLQNDITGQVQSDIQPLIEYFRLEGRECSPLFRFWDDYLNEVSLPIKMFLASSRHGIWDVNQYAKTKLLPFLFASNRTVYSRFMPYQVLAMKRIPESLSEKFEKGLFVTKLTRGPFNAYVLEVTENKALKSSGGITHNNKALVRWFLARPVTAKYAMAYNPNNDTNQGTVSNKHHTDTHFHIQSYNEGVRNMLDLFDETFIDPFSMSNPPTKLVNFATGVQAPSDVETSLLSCHQTGKQMLHSFVSERLMSDGENHKKFFDPLPRTKVKTMSSTKSKVKAKSKFVQINGEEMYLRLLAINSFKKVLSYENSPVPLSLFTDDGIMMATKKSEFLEKLENISGSPCSVRNVENPDCVVFDAMGIVQMLQPNTGAKLSFIDMASTFWSYILFHSNGVSCVHVVFDRYVPNSLKSTTRQKRGENVSLATPVVMQYNMVIPDWKKLLTSSRSKAALTTLYTKYLTDNCHTLLKNGQNIYISGGMGDRVLRVSWDTIFFHDTSNQEEADTRILLHLKYAKAVGVGNVVVVSPDTDVLVLLVHHFKELGFENLYFKTGRKGLYTDLTRFIPVHVIFEYLSPDERSILLPVYCLTGCDTCSSFFGIGKKKAFLVMRKHFDKLTHLSMLGSEHILSPLVKAVSVLFVGLLYGCHQCVSLNTLRANIVIERLRTKPRKLPPTDDSFHLHLLRCAYQMIIWKAALESNVVLPDPSKFGYVVDVETGLFIPHMMAQSVAPPELLSDLVCMCTDECLNDCICCQNEQPCTKACGCSGSVDDYVICQNLFTVMANLTDDILD